MMLTATGLLAALAAPALAQNVLTQAPVLVNPTCTGDQNGSITFRLPSDSTDYLFDWSGGNAVTGLTPALYHQSGLQAATYTIYILNIMTLADTTISLTLIAPNPLLVSAGQDVRTCVGQAVRLSGTASAAGTFTWSYTDGSGTPRTLTGAVVNIPGTGTGSLNVNTSTTVALHVVTPAGCSDDDTLVIQTNPIPTANFSFSQSAICVGSTVDVTFTGSASADAVYSWVLISGGGIFTENGLTTVTGIGPHTIRFDQAGTGSPPLRSVLLRVTEPTTNGSACQANRSGTLQVQAPPALSVAGLAAKYCINASTVTLLPTPSGGTFRGPGIVGYSFSPATAGIGTHTLVYKFITPLGCTDSLALITSVYALPIAGITGLDTAYCRGMAGVALGLTPTGGILSGSGTRSPNLFYPDSAALGFLTQRYSVTDTNGCSDTTTAQTHVKPTPRLSATPDSAGICSGGSTGIILTPSVGGTTIAYAAATFGSVAGASSGTGPSIVQTLTGGGSVVYTATSTLNGCASPVARSIVTVTAKPTAIGTPPSQSVCSGTAGQIVFSSGQPGITYAYTVAASSPGITGAVAGTGDTLAPTLANTSPIPGQVRYVVTPTALGCAGDTFSVSFTVLPTPAAQIISADTAFCSGDSVRLSLTGPVAGTTFTYTPSLQSGAATGFAPAVGNRLAQQLINTDTVTAVVAYQIQPIAAGCPGPALIVHARVSAKPVMRNLTDTISLCSGNAFSQVLRSTPSGSTFAWSPFAVSGTVTGAAAGSGVTLSGTLTGEGITGYRIVPTLTGCAGLPDTLYIRTYTKPVVTFLPASLLVCTGQPAGVSLESSVAGAQIFWRPIVTASVTGATSGTGSAISDTLRNTTRVTANQVYRVWATVGSCTSDTINVTVQVRVAQLIGSSPTSVSPCSGDSVRINLLANPAGGVSFTWRMHTAGNVTGPLSGTGSRIRFAPVSTDSTTQVVVIRALASGACNSDSLSINVNVRPRPRFVITPPMPICAGGAVQIGVRLVPRSATFSYGVSDSAGVHGLSSGTTRPINQTVTGGGTYRFTFTSTIVGCSSTQDVTGLVNPAPAKPTITASGPLTLCPGQSVTLSTTSTDALQWQLNHVDIPAPAGISTSIVATLAGTYTLRATSAAGCGSATDSVIVIQAIPPAQPVVSGDSGFCPGGMANLTSTPATTYAWLRNDTLVLPAQSGQTLTVGVAGTYAVIVSNATGCTDTSAGFAVLARPAPAAPILSGPTQLCAGDTLTLRAAATAGTLQWLLNSLPIASATSDSLRVSSAGVYAVRLTDRFGCMSLSLNDTVKNGPVPAQPVISGPSALCAGDSITLASSGTALGLHTRWFRNDTLLADTGTTLVVHQPGLYKLSVQITGGCSGASDTFRVSPASAPAVPVITGASSFCTGSSTVLTGPTGATTYTWLRNDTVVSGATTATLGVSRPGVYTLRVTNAAGCSATSLPDTVSELAAPTASAIVTPTSTCGATDGTITLTLSGGSGRFGYLYTGAGVVPTAQNQAALAAGTYAVTVTDSATNCTVTLLSLVVQDTGLFAALATVTQPLSCARPAGSIAITIDTAKGPFSYAWTGTGTGIRPGQRNQDSLSPGTYQVVILQTATGCSRTLSGIVVDTPSLAKPIITGVPALCNGSATTLYSSDTTGNQWYRNGILIAGATADSLIVTQASTYTVVATVGTCTVTSDTLAVILSPNPPRPLLSGDTTFCPGSQGRLISSVPVSQWLLNGLPIALTGDTIATTAFGGYQAVARNAAGCADTSLPFVTRPIRFNLAVTKQDPTACANPDGRARVTYNAPGATVVFKDALGNILATGQDTIAGLAPGLYRVVVSNGICADSADYIIAVPGNFSVTATPSAANCGLADGSATASFNGAASPTLTWYRVNGTGGLDSLTTGGSVAGLASGNYVLIGTEASCRDTARFTIADTLRRTISLVRPAAACGLGSGLARINSPSTLTSIVWVDGGGNVLSTNDSLVAPAGTYTVRFSAGACMDSATVIIGGSPAPTLATSATTTTTCTSSDGTAMADFGPGATYAWFLLNGPTRTPAGVTASLTGLGIGIYRVVATLGTCIDSGTVSVGRPAGCGSNLRHSSHRRFQPGYLPGRAERRGHRPRYHRRLHGRLPVHVKQCAPAAGSAPIACTAALSACLPASTL